MNAYIFIIYIFLVCGVSQLLLRLANDWYQSLIYTVGEKYNTIRNMYAIKDRLMSLPDVDRVMIFQQITARDGIYIKALYGNSKYKREWSPTSVDSDYIEMMSELEGSRDYYEFETENQPDNWLNSIYEREGIKYSKIYYIAAKREKKSLLDLFLFRKPKKLGFYYMSLSNKSGRHFSEDTELKIKNDILNLQYNLKYE